MFFNIDQNERSYSIQHEFTLPMGETYHELTFLLTPLQALDDIKLKQPVLKRVLDDIDQDSTLEGKIHMRAIRVMSHNEYRISVHDNTKTWLIFAQLCLMSVGIPLVLWVVVR